MVRVSTFCCGCSLKTGTIIIGVYYLVMYIFSLSIVSFFLALTADKNIQRKVLRLEVTDTSINRTTYEKDFNTTEVILGVLLAVAILCILVSVVLIVGAVKEKPRLIYIWFVVHVTFFVMQLVAITITGMTNIGPMTGSVWPTVMNILLTIYFLIVVYSYYKELKEKGEVRPKEPTAFNIEGYPVPAHTYHQPTEPPPYTEEKHFEKGPDNYVKF